LLAFFDLPLVMMGTFLSTGQDNLLRLVEIDSTTLDKQEDVRILLASIQEQAAGTLEGDGIVFIKVANS